MERGIPEADWKIFRQLREIWLDRYCTNVNAEIKSLLSNPGLSSHARYLKIYRLIHEKDKKLGFAFDDSRRSTAIEQIRIIKSLGVVTEDELGRFSKSTREFVLARWE